MTRTILSLFDHSGAWSKPYADNGYRVIRVDIKPTKEPAPDGVTQLVSDARFLEYIDEEIHGIILAPPCTDFSTSGAQYWPAKDKDGRTAASLALVDAGLRAVALYKPHWWTMENPIGRLRRWAGQPAYSFDPCDFAGLMHDHKDFGKVDDIRTRAIAGPDNLNAEDVRIVKEIGAYTKKTLLWGNFYPPQKERIAPVVIKDAQRGRSYSPIHWFSGGKSERTKELRSVTPTGFAQAFFEANP